MKVLVIGQGGREHAIVKALSQSIERNDLFAIPGREGFLESRNCQIPPDKIAEFLTEHKIELAVIGPEQELADGLSDELRNEGFLVFGPSKKAAQLETSKIFSKKFMKEFGLPTGRYEEVESYKECLSKAEMFSKPWVLKADGLAAGKGVYLCQNRVELEKAADKIFIEKVHDKAGSRALLEEHLDGWELSYFILTNGRSYETLPLVMDHKRLRNQNQGPNTGGMGAVAPIKIDDRLHKRIHEEILKPTVQGLQESKLLYRGVLFIGLMITEEGPKVLEYNVRFGDPETQVLLPLLDGNWSHIFSDVAAGKLPEMKWKNQWAATVVLAAPGYPDNVVNNVPIHGNLKGNEHGYFLHAGSGKINENWVTTGGRVLNAIAIADSQKKAIEKAYEIADRVSWDGLQMRTDIGAYIK
jgi:phosphoribosylamine---glycine ligase